MLAPKFGVYGNRKYNSGPEWKQIQSVLKVTRETYGHMIAEEFGADHDLSRAVVKRKAITIKALTIYMFQHIKSKCR